MKSIKERAEEYAPYTREDSWSRTQKCIIAQTSFEAGANYVLEEIESVLKEDECNDRPWLLKGERLYNKLATKIKELKGE